MRFAIKFLIFGKRLHVSAVEAMPASRLIQYARLAIEWEADVSKAKRENVR